MNKKNNTTDVEKSDKDTKRTEKMKIIPITFKRANEFVKEFHRHNKPVVGAKLAIGLMRDKEIIGVAIAGRPVARGLDNKYTAEITRVCVKEGYKNSCSMLYSRMKRILMMMGYERVVTYTLESESQSSLKAVGAAPVDLIKGRSWNTPSREREDQDVYFEPKIRWEL